MTDEEVVSSLSHFEKQIDDIVVKKLTFDVDKIERVVDIIDGDKL
jgi:hypothetical protein